jgi:hypothetical protein
LRISGGVVAMSIHNGYRLCGWLTSAPTDGHPTLSEVQTEMSVSYLLRGMAAEMHFCSRHQHNMSGAGITKQT